MHGPINVKAPNNTSKWQMGFNSAFKGLSIVRTLTSMSLEDIFFLIKAPYGRLARRPGAGKRRKIMYFIYRLRTGNVYVTIYIYIYIYIALY